MLMSDHFLSSRFRQYFYLKPNTDSSHSQWQVKFSNIIATLSNMKFGF